MKLLNDKAQKNLKSVIKKLPAIELKVINILKLADRDEPLMTTSDVTSHNELLIIPTEPLTYNPFIKPQSDLNPNLSSVVSEGDNIRNKSAYHSILD